MCVAIDLGCGPNKREGAIGVDNVALPGVDVVHDLLCFPYPFEEGSVDRAFLSHVLEHFTIEQGQAVLNEILRILRPGGELEIHVPHAFCPAAWMDPTHRRYFTFASVRFYTRDYQKAYYRETGSNWDLISTSASATPLDLKGYRLRRIDGWFGRRVAAVLNWFLRRPNCPSIPDLLVKAWPLFFVDICWVLAKPAQD